MWKGCLPRILYLKWSNLSTLPCYCSCCRKSSRVKNVDVVIRILIECMITRMLVWPVAHLRWLHIRPLAGSIITAPTRHQSRSLLCPNHPKPWIMTINICYWSSNFFKQNYVFWNWICPYHRISRYLLRSQGIPLGNVTTQLGAFCCFVLFCSFFFVHSCYLSSN